MVKSNHSYLWFSISYTLLNFIPYLHPKYGIYESNYKIHNYWCRLYFINERKNHRSQPALGINQLQKARSSRGRGLAEMGRGWGKLINRNLFSDRRDLKAARPSESRGILTRMNRTSIMKERYFSNSRIQKLFGPTNPISNKFQSQQSPHIRSRKRVV